MVPPRKDCDRPLTLEEAVQLAHDGAARAQEAIDRYAEEEAARCPDIETEE